jgi:hypothetical protein
MPNVPSPFTPFLEDKSNSKENLKHLEFERKHLREMIKKSQEQLKLIDRRIVDVKKQTKPTSSPPLI